MMPVGGASVFGIGLDFAILAAATTIFVIIGARLYPNVVT